MRVGGIIVTWRLLDSERGDRLSAALEHGSNQASRRMRDPRQFARALGKVMIGNVWALGLIGVLTLAGCTLFGGPSATGDQSLTQIQWCDSKDISFQDQARPTAATADQLVRREGPVGLHLLSAVLVPQGDLPGACQRLHP